MLKRNTLHRDSRVRERDWQRWRSCERMHPHIGRHSTLNAKDFKSAGGCTIKSQVFMNVPYAAAKWHTPMRNWIHSLSVLKNLNELLVVAIPCLQVLIVNWSAFALLFHSMPSVSPASASASPLLNHSRKMLASVNIRCSLHHAFLGAWNPISRP